MIENFDLNKNELGKAVANFVIETNKLSEDERKEAYKCFEHAITHATMNLTDGNTIGDLKNEL